MSRAHRPVLAVLGALVVPLLVAPAAHATNSPPVLDAIGDKAGSEGTQLQFTVSATDADADPLTYSVTNNPSGSSIDPSTGVFTWTPSYTQAGQYSNVHFQVTDGTDTDSEDITITISDVDQAPVLTAIGSKVVDPGTLLQFTLSATDADAGDSLTYSASNLPPGATFDANTATFSWTPTFLDSGAYSGVHFQVDDDHSPTSAGDFENIVVTVNEGIFTKTSLRLAKTRSKLKASGKVTPPDGGGSVSVRLTHNGHSKTVEADLDSEGLYSARFRRPNRGQCRVTAKYPGAGAYEDSSARKSTSC
jgi:Putative Ig domain